MVRNRVRSVKALRGLHPAHARPAPTLRRNLLNSDMVARLVPVFEETDAPAAVSVTGTIGVLEGTVIDADTNNPENTFNASSGLSSNNSPSEASNFPTPGQRGLH